MNSVENAPLAVSRIGLGCSNFGREIPEDAAFALMDHAVARGITLFDTAEGYGAAEAREHRREKYGIDDHREASDEAHSSEKIVGRWLRSRGARRAITLLTKISRNYRPDVARRALAASLERLQTEQVDIYLYHSYDPAVSPAEAVAAGHELVRRGWTRTLGCSNFPAAKVEACLAEARRAGATRFTFGEYAYSLINREIEHELLPLARREGLGVLGYSPLAGGFLTGKYSPDRNAIPQGSRFHVVPGYADRYFSDRSFRILARLREFSDRLRIPPAQLALAWAFRNRAVGTLLISGRTPAHLEQALTASALTLPEEVAAELDACSLPAEPAGAP
jgi:aryl-alcohol dehydrogenase-like predicted oxidoreductase